MSAQLPAVTEATRHRRATWRNPRIVVGVLIVAACVLLGARLMRASDDTVGVWAVARDLPQGASLAASDLEVRQVRFQDAGSADRYLLASQRLPAKTVLGREVRAGELLPRSAIADSNGPALVEVPLSVQTNDLPATVRQGSRVDVWVTPDQSVATEAAPANGSNGSNGRAVRVLTEVVVVAVPRRADSLAPDSSRQVIVGVSPQAAPGLDTALGALSRGRVVIARKG